MNFHRWLLGLSFVILVLRTGGYEEGRENNDAFRRRKIAKGEIENRQVQLKLCKDRVSTFLENDAEVNSIKVRNEDERRNEVAFDGIETRESLNLLKSKAYWLTVMIPTVRRKKDLDYLGQTLDSLLVNLPSSSTDPLWGSVKIVIFNSNPEDHIVFERNKARLSNNIHFDFVVNNHRSKNPFPGKKDKGSRNKPGYKVRQQTRDVVDAMRYVDEHYRYSYFLFMEDDFELCNQGFDTIRYLLNRATLYHGEWMAIRASFGLNGIFIQQQDVRTLADYFEKHQARRPPDHLIVEWYAGETDESSKQKSNRVNVAFRYNLWDHIGIQSTIRAANHRRNIYPKCWEELGEPVNFQVDSFSPDDCPNDDIWPCDVGWSKDSTCHKV